MKMLLLIPLLIVLFGSITNCLELNNGAYENFVIKISDSVPPKDCKIILENLELTLTSASQYLFSALDSRAYLRSATVLLPFAWPDSCVVKTAVVSGSGETPDMTILLNGPARGKILTQQSLGCGQPADQIYLTYDNLLQNDNNLGRLFVREFAKYRYGVFDERGFYNDPIYPLCYLDHLKDVKATGCSDLPIRNDICKDIKIPYNISRIIDDKARSSIMFDAEAQSVSMFCDDGNHDRFAPTKHNFICQRRSVLDVILNHRDFKSINFINNNLHGNQITDTTPKINYRRQNLTRFVFVIENTKDMMQRESWSYLRLAMRQWALNVLPENTEIGMVLTDETSNKALNIVSIQNRAGSDRFGARDKFYSTIPYTPGDSMQTKCLHCSIKDATDMLNERTKTHGNANNVIVIIAAGMEHNQHIDKVLEEVTKAKIKIATITYPAIHRMQTLNYLADKTNGVAYTVFEQKLNVDTTLLSTYFELQNVLYNIVERFYENSPNSLPMEIHRREITDDGRNSITGSFVLDQNMGEPAQFTFFTHNTVTPLIKGLKLISPSHQVYTNRNDRFIDFKMIILNANISEPGTWTYTVEPYPGNPQPHFLQVIATPVENTPIVRARFWTHRNNDKAPLVLLTQVKFGEIPVFGAKVQVIVTKLGINGSAEQKIKFQLLDTGSGDPDITKGDGIYTRYFSAQDYGAGLYTFEVMVNDNGNTAYTWSEPPSYNDDEPCCGSVISSPSSNVPISPFQRILPKQTMMISTQEISSSTLYPVGRIGDLRVQVMPEDMKARLIWTSPDMGGHTVSRYEIKYAHSMSEILDRFETDAISWENAQPFPLAPGSETTFTLDFSQYRELLDKVLYFAIKSYPSELTELLGPISNPVRVVVPSPPPPPTVPPTFSSNDQTYWPHNVNGVGVDHVGPSIAKNLNIGLELILPISIGFILLIILLVLYCYFCILKRRDHRVSHKKSNKTDKLTSAISILPGTSQNLQQSNNYITDIPDPHHIGVPVSTYDYEDETKKRYSLVNQQEQQLIEELKQQQQMQQHLQRECDNIGSMYSGLSIISNRNGHTLSPYNSWSASQLLHEHERRHSPMENLNDTEQMNIHQELLMTQDHISLNSTTPLDHGNLNLMENNHLISGHCHIPPPVPPLPAFNSNGYPINYSIYGVHQKQQQQQQTTQQPIYQSMQRGSGGGGGTSNNNNNNNNNNNETMVPFSSSLQGSLSSVNSGDKKRRNVTMV